MEVFAEFNVDHIRYTFRVIFNMYLVMSFRGSVSVIKVGCMAGKFPKPCSYPYEVKDGFYLPYYHGYIINS